MHVMKCPECGAENLVAREYCRSCSEYLWPRPAHRCVRPVCRVAAGEEPTPTGIRGTAARILRRLFRSHAGAR